jgi:hypothetical protein
MFTCKLGGPQNQTCEFGQKSESSALIMRKENINRMDLKDDTLFNNQKGSSCRPHHLKGRHILPMDDTLDAF